MNETARAGRSLSEPGSVCRASAGTTAVRLLLSAYPAGAGYVQSRILLDQHLRDELRSFPLCLSAVSAVPGHGSWSSAAACGPGGPRGPGAAGPGGPLGSPTFPTHPYARSPRDFFMYYDKDEPSYVR